MRVKCIHRCRFASSWRELSDVLRGTASSIPRMVAGFEQPSEGRILIDGVDVDGLPPFKRPTNTVFQSYALFPHLSVEDNVAFGLRRKGVDKAETRRRVREELERVGLEGEANRKPRQLSGGQQQRVALARALVNLPTVLLLDEPLGALDLKLRKGLQIELKRIQRDVGITFVYVTHDQEEALTMSDRIAVMSNGNVEQVETQVNGIATGERCHAVVRPEKLRIDSDGRTSSGWPSVEGMVESSVFLGTA